MVVSRRYAEPRSHFGFKRDVTCPQKNIKPFLVSFNARLPRRSLSLPIVTAGDPHTLEFRSTYLTVPISPQPTVRL